MPFFKSAPKTAAIGEAQLGGDSADGYIVAQEKVGSSPTVVTVSCVQFALFFVDFWFQLARWIDSTILDALYGWGFGADRPHTNFDPLIGLNNAFGDMLLNFVMAMMFIVLPTFWVMALAWAGVRTGNIVQGLSTATSDAKGAGGAWRWYGNERRIEEVTAVQSSSVTCGSMRQSLLS